MNLQIILSLQMTTLYILFNICSLQRCLPLCQLRGMVQTQPGLTFRAYEQLLPEKAHLQNDNRSLHQLCTSCIRGSTGVSLYLHGIPYCKVNCKFNVPRIHTSFVFGKILGMHGLILIMKVYYSSNMLFTFSHTRSVLRLARRANQTIIILFYIRFTSSKQPHLK